MDMKLLREKFYSKWINKPFVFQGMDGYTYNARAVQDWLEDGTLVLEDVSVCKDKYVKQQKDDGATYIRDEKRHLYWRSKLIFDHDIRSLLVNERFIGLILEVGDLGDSDKMVGDVAAERQRRWDKWTR